MADVTPLVRQGTQIIQSYADGGFKISGMQYGGGVIALAERVIEWSPPDFDALAPDHFTDLLDIKDQIDVVLLGTGAQIRLLLPQIRKELHTRGLSVEAMDTGAACRTYNVLVAEGRRVAAALYPKI